MYLVLCKFSLRGILKKIKSVNRNGSWYKDFSAACWRLPSSTFARFGASEFPIPAGKGLLRLSGVSRALPADPAGCRAGHQCGVGTILCTEFSSPSTLSLLRLELQSYHQTKLKGYSTRLQTRKFFQTSTRFLGLCLSCVLCAHASVFPVIVIFLNTATCTIHRTHWWETCYFVNNVPAAEITTIKEEFLYIYSWVKDGCDRTYIEATIRTLFVV